MAKKIYTDEEARLRKNQRQREYSKRTGYAASKKYNVGYHAEHRKNIGFRLSSDRDNDIYLYICVIKNRTGYLKKIIRNSINKLPFPILDIEFYVQTDFECNNLVDSIMIPLPLYVPQDSDIYDHLQLQPNKSAYIKGLIREDMAARGISFE